MKRSNYHFFWLKSSLIVLLTVGLMTSCLVTPKSDTEYIRNSGKMFGTFYTITYQHPEGKDIHTDILEKMKEFDLSLSTYNPNSIISRINQNDTSVLTDSYFDEMFEMAQYVAAETHGAFDITVAPLVNAWGFGFTKLTDDENPDVEEILAYVGYQKIKLKDAQLLKDDQRILIDASAIAKGQASDVIAHLLEVHGCRNFMVEIGGEVVSRGLNPNGKPWQIGIDVPAEDMTDAGRELQTILGISGVGLATSGNYRQFYYRDGKKYAHTIDPRTGYPVEHNLLSATVVAPTCMEADAFATAFMVLGVDSAIAISNRIPQIECYLIYTDENGLDQVTFTDGFPQYFSE